MPIKELKKSRFMFKLFAALKDVIYPNRCLSCKHFFNIPAASSTIAHRKNSNLDIFYYSEIMAPFICPKCRMDFIPIHKPICPICGLPYLNTDTSDHVCGECITNPKYFSSAKAAGIYDGSLRSAIHTLKYKRKTQLALPLGRLLFDYFRRYWELDQIDLIIPVPLHKTRLRVRGFNQSFLILKKWKQMLSLQKESETPISIENDVLIRTRNTSPQTGINRKNRQSNIRNAFQLRSVDRVKRKNILLIDDVFTTGATLNECAKVLTKHGANCVQALTLARSI